MRLTDEQVIAAVTELYKVTADAEAAQAVALDKAAAAARLASSLHDLLLAERWGADVVEPVEDAVKRGAIPYDPRLRVLPGGQAS